MTTFKLGNITDWLNNALADRTDPLDWLREITKHGCQSGTVSELIYYRDTVAFYDQHVEEIWEMLYDAASDQGITPIQLIASFNGQEHVGSDEQFKNLLCWYAVEERARELLDKIEGDSND